MDPPFRVRVRVVMGSRFRARIRVTGRARRLMDPPFRARIRVKGRARSLMGPPFKLPSLAHVLISFSSVCEFQAHPLCPLYDFSFLRTCTP